MHVIQVPKYVISPDGDIPIRMVDPFRSYCEIEPPDDMFSPYVIDFWGTDQGALLLVHPVLDEAEVRILFPLGAEPGTYQYDAHFFHFETGAPLFKEQGSFDVAQGKKKDCGCHTLKTLPKHEHDHGLAEKRLSVCAGCDENENGVCLACGCVLKHKAGVLHESCPLGKWPSNEELLQVPDVPKKKGKKS